jgi:hypothetical protein
MPKSVNLIHNDIKFSNRLIHSFLKGFKVYFHALFNFKIIVK